MRTYEAVFILDPKRIKDGGDKFAKQASEHVESLGGKVHKTVSLGRKHFARPIGRHRAGVYWDLVIDLDPAAVDSMKEHYRLDDDVLRLAVFHYEEGSDPSKIMAKSHA